MPRRIVTAVETVLFGKRAVVETAVVCLAAGGHLLLEDVPGVGKTMLARALAGAIGGTMSRIQFTSDLLPADILGCAIYNPSLARFEVRKGPIFAHVVLADEINRATPRAQSALLECLGERQVTIDRESYHLERPFLVIATQNPARFEGCYPLIESQLDRFQARLSLGYPDHKHTARMLRETENGHPIDRLTPVVTLEEVQQMGDASRAIHVADSLLDYIAALLEATRTVSGVRLGASPRAGIDLLALSRARALLDGADHVTPDDIQALLEPVLAHRLVLDRAAETRGLTKEGAIRLALEAVPCP